MNDTKIKDTKMSNAKIEPLKGMVFAALFAALTAAIAPLKIPLGFTPVPITLQTIGVLLAGAVLGPYYGALSMILYVSVGALGLPVFAGGSGGIKAILGPTGGYLLSYPFAAFIIGLFSGIKKPILKYLPALILAALAIIVYLDIFLGIGFMKLCDSKTGECITVVSQMTGFQNTIAVISLVILVAIATAGIYLSRKKLISFNTVAAMFAGTIIIYIGGSLRGASFTGLPWSAIFAGWVMPFIIGDMIKLFISAYIANSIDFKKYLR